MVRFKHFRGSDNIDIKINEWLEEEVARLSGEGVHGKQLIVEQYQYASGKGYYPTCLIKYRTENKRIRPPMPD